MSERTGAGAPSRRSRLLHVVRHAKSSWADPSIRDVDRPLSARGRRAAALLAAHLAELGVAPSLVLCSPARRTTETLDALEPAFADRTAVRIVPSLYGATADEMLDLLVDLPSDVDAAMVIGHNPGAQDLVLGLAGSGEDGMLDRVARKYPTGAIATLRHDGEWSDLARRSAVLTALTVPRDLA